MHKTARRLAASCAVMTMAICLCISLVTVSGAGLSLISKSELPVISDIVPTKTAEAKAPSPTENGNNPSASTPEATEEAGRPASTLKAATATIETGLPGSIIGQMDEIQEQVVDLRGLAPKRPVDQELLTPEQLRQRIIDDFIDDYSEEEAAEDVIFLAAFGLIDPEFDLLDLYIELYSEQIAGFYDDEAEKMHVVQGEDFRGTERLTYAHEYVHALQDQHFDLDEGLNYNDEACEVDAEKCAAVLALIEGDATFSEIAWLSEYASMQDLRDIQQFYNNYQSPVFDSAPAFLQEDFVFPYLFGQSFVEYFHNQGGWPAVNEIYENPPVSTEQIIHPEKYPDEKPLPVILSDFGPALGEGWQEVDGGVMGEWYTHLILAYGLDPGGRLNESSAQTAAAGWGGDAYKVYYNFQEESTVMVLQTIWDANEDAVEFYTAFREYGESRFGAATSSTSEQISWDNPERYVEFHIEEAVTIWLLTPDKAIAQELQEVMETEGE